MNYELTEGQKNIQKEMAAFCKSAIAPHAGLLDTSPKERVAELMKENLKNLGHANYLSLTQEADRISQCLAAEELAKVCPATFLSAMSSTTAFGFPLISFGTEAQLSKHIPGIRKGKLVGALAYSEADAGSDLAGIRATAEKRGNQWVLSGTKDLVTNAPIADAFLVIAWTDQDAGLDKGLTLFILDRGTPGLSVGDPIETMGLRGALISEIRLQGCLVSDDAILGGRPGEGYGQLMKILEAVKLCVSAMAVGLGVACMEDSTAYAKNRKAFGKPIGLFEGVGAKLAMMFTFNDLGRLLTLRAAWGMDNGDPEAAVLASCAKLFTSEAAGTIADLAMQIHGGHGYLKGTVVERLYRDARFAEIGYGTSEMLRVFIAKDSLNKFKPS